MDIVDVSKRIAGARSTSEKPTAASQIGAIAASDSANGRVDVYIEGVPVEVATNVSVKSGQSVTVTVVNHVPTVTGVAGWGDQVAVKIGEIAADVAYIDQAYVQELVANSITAASIVAASLYVGTLEAGDVTADSINAAVAKVDLLDAEAISAAVAKIGELDVEQLAAVVAKVGTLDAELINAAVAKVGQLETGKLDADMANIDVANISTAYVKWLNAGYAHIAEGVIDNAKIRFADVQDVEIESAMIDVAEIRDMLVKSGIIGEFVSESGKITGVLDAVRINADAIKAGTLSVDRLMLRGENGLFYAVNASTDGVTAEQLATEEYRNAMHGDNIVASSITADKISVGDLVAFGATVGGLVIEDGCLRSFAKTSAASESAGFYLGADGSFSLGGRGHIKYDAATDNLDISASNISVDASPLVVSTAEQFYQSSSPTSLSGGSWSSSQPAWAQGRYVWRRTRVDYSDGSYDFTPSDKGVCITGNTGADGKNGSDGKDGAAGKGVKSNAVAYQASTSGTTAPTGTWAAAIPSVAANQYLWTRIVITYTDGSTTTAYSVGKMGANGAPGDPGAPGAPGAAGVGVKATAVTYQASTSGTAAPTGTWTAAVPSVAANQYLWTRIVITYTNGTSSTAYSVGKMGANGAPGKDGANGKDGTNGKDGAAGANGKMLYGASNTAAATAAKVTASNIAGFSLYVGSTVSIKFTYANTAVSPTLNVNGTGAKQIRLNGANSAYWGAGSTVQFVYDGTYWQTCNTPLYGSTATIGNPAGYHVYIDGDSVSVMNGASLLSEFQGNSVRLCGGTMTIAADSGSTSEDSRMTFHGGSFSFDPAVTGGFSVGGSSVATLKTLNGYKGLGASNADYSSWMRTPSAGLLPYQSGGASALGTASWPFGSMYTNNMYAGGTQLTGDGHWLYVTGGAFSELCTNKSSAYPVYGAKVLYDNGSGVWGTITLNETAANFQYMEFYFKKPEGDHFWNCSKVYLPNNKRVGFIVAQVAPGSVTQTLMGGVAIVGTSVSIYTMSRYNNGSAWAMDSTTLRIYRIVGYR